MQPILYSFAKTHGFLSLQDGGEAVVGMREGADPLYLQEVRRTLGHPFSVKVLSHADFEKQLSELYSLDGLAAEELAEDVGRDDELSSLIEDMPKAADLLDAQDDAPVIRLINGLIAQAVKAKASDIHIEPFENRLFVRLRIDGVLQEVSSLPSRLTPVFVSRLKVMSRLDIAEKRIPQDGRISLTLGGKALDVRVSTLPSRHGERVVMRLLDKEQAHFSLGQLGMPEATLKTFRRILNEPNGILLVTGPTGSGKTTTMYAGLTLLNDQTRNILTVEDPVEYALEGVGQTQVNTKVGMTFAAGLRAILRQDPDVVMVGEIRDAETVEIAVQASLTGHLVLSTVHTNSAASAITRLRDMGVEPFLLASTVKGILAQRLVRRLCTACRHERSAEKHEKEQFTALGIALDRLYEAKGCPACNHTGYDGRVGLYELLVVDDALKRMIHDDAREEDIEAHAFKNTDTLRTSGFRHVANGTTTLEEVLRVVKAGGHE